MYAPGARLDAVGTTATAPVPPPFCAGLERFGPAPPRFDRLGSRPAIAPDRTAIVAPRDEAAVFQTLLAADALRHLTLLMTATKASGHPGGFASAADAVAALIMLGHKHLFTGAGHHAPGFYAALFLDRSLEAIGIDDVRSLRTRFRERDGLPGHVSGQIPGILNPAGPLGQGQHFALAAARLHPDTLCALTIGDGELDEPYVLSSLSHFTTAYPAATNVLPVLVWNGYSQEHHSMISTRSNAEMTRLWESHGFDRVTIVDAHDHHVGDDPSGFVDMTGAPLEARLDFTRALLVAVDDAARCARDGVHSAIVVKQLKGSGMHARGTASHSLAVSHTTAHPEVARALDASALPPAAWALVRTNVARAGGGPAGRTVVTEAAEPLADLGTLPIAERAPGAGVFVSTAEIGRILAHVGRRDPDFVVTGADGNQASGLGEVNRALRVAHPTADAACHQGPGGRVYEPVSEDACAGLAAGLALMGGRAVWCSYESFAVNGLPVWQTVTQAMAELRRPTPAAVALLTAGALEQGRNGWTHQRPEIEAYLAAMIRNGNVFPLYPPDANGVQVCLEWALGARNKGIVILASKSPLPIRTTLATARRALRDGAVVLQESPGLQTVTFAVAGDIVLGPVHAAADRLQALGVGSRIVVIVNPRRLYRPEDVAWERCAEPDGGFIGDATFERLFGGDALIGVTGGAGATLEPVLLRSQARRDLVVWKRGDTAASAEEICALNDLTSDTLVARALTLTEAAPAWSMRQTG